MVMRRLWPGISNERSGSGPSVSDASHLSSAASTVGAGVGGSGVGAGVGVGDGKCVQQPHVSRSPQSHLSNLPPAATQSAWGRGSRRAVFVRLEKLHSRGVLNTVPTQYDISFMSS